MKKHPSILHTLFLSISPLIFTACTNNGVTQNSNVDIKTNQYTEFTLNSDLHNLSVNQKEMLKTFFEVAEIMDDLFWVQSFGNKENALALSNDSANLALINLNYGPWDRLNGEKSFINGIGEKPLGAQFYPEDLTKAEFDSLKLSDKTSLYTVVKRDSNGNLKTIPYSIAYKNQLEKASALLLQASELAENAEFKKYLKLRSKAFLSNNYLASDLAWMDMKTNKIDFVVGPIENYEDRLYNYKAAFEAYILIKDFEWSKRLDKYTSLLPQLQKKLPVPEAYKAEDPSTNSDLGAYDVIYYAGDCNAGPKTIAINLPNDPIVQAQKGSRRLQLKNAMQAKYEKILIPIAYTLITPDQQKNISFNAFFENTMFHEVAHGIGIHHTITSGETIREAMKDRYSELEEGKADILGIFLVKELIDMGELKTNIMDNYVTFTAGLFRSIRFGASSPHGIANLVRYNYFKEREAFTRSKDGIYTIDPNKMYKAIESLTEKILTIQGDGDYNAAIKLTEDYGYISEELKKDLKTINSKNIPIDIVFKQGATLMGLE